MKQLNFRGMIGAARCQQVLEEILERLNDRKITKVVTSRIHDFRRGLVQLRNWANTDPCFAQEMLELWKHDTLRKIEERRAFVGEECYTFWRNCIIMEYRQTCNTIRDRARHGKEVPV